MGFTGEEWRALTRVIVDLVHTCGAVLATMRNAIVQIALASIAREAGWAMAFEAAVGKRLTFAVRFARIVEARVDDLLAALAVERRRAIAHEPVGRERAARAIVGAAVLVGQARVALAAELSRFRLVCNKKEKDERSAVMQGRMVRSRDDVL